jgi:ABC-type nitrate/sulfonate/bicarbonate transport system substrate-binding protein
MNASKKLSLAAVGTLLAFALAAAPETRTREVTVGAQPTPYSADHARIQAPAEEQPAQF